MYKAHCGPTLVCALGLTSCLQFPHTRGHSPSHLEPQAPHQPRPLSVCRSCLSCVDALLPPLCLLAAFIVILEDRNTTTFVKPSLTSSSTCGGLITLCEN